MRGYLDVAYRLGLLVSQLDNAAAQACRLHFRGDIADVAELIIRSAEQRKESRGLHYMEDHPAQASEAVDTVIHDKPGGPLT